MPEGKTGAFLECACEWRDGEVTVLCGRHMDAVKILKDRQFTEFERRLEEASRAWKDYRENKRFRGSDAPSAQRAWDELTRSLLGDE